MARNVGSSGLEPVAVALILCDHVHIDPLTGTFTILGIFHGIEAEEFPVIYPKLAIYVALADGRGQVPVTVRLVDVDEERDPLFSETQPIEFEDPRDIQEWAFDAWDVVFPESGIYRLQLLAAGATIMEYSVVIKGATGGAEPWQQD